MTELTLPPSSGGDRFPDFSVMAQASHWDDATRDVIEARIEHPPEDRSFFTPHEALTATALFNQLLDQKGEPHIPVMEMVDSRLAAGETDGWHYEGMDQDSVSWRASLGWLDEDAVALGQPGFALSGNAIQILIIQKVQDLGSKPWHGVPGTHFWSLWTRYACTAFYSHPAAWQEIGFPGPAYPRGYKNIGIDRREPFEVRDAHPNIADEWAPES